MKLDIRPGKYVVAVSGGVDSMALLHALAQLAGQKGFELSLVVAHFDHGIRHDSAEDRKLVAAVAVQYGLPYIYEQGFLGAGASEARAREARYAFLAQAREAQRADAVMTAHHQDDVIETALLNMLRGTGGRGLSSLRSTAERVRPLLNVTKAQLLAYAAVHQLRWREDSTNQDTRYLRNYIRHQTVPKMSTAQRQLLLQAIERAAELYKEIDAILLPYSGAGQLDRRWFMQLPHAVAREAMAAWLRRNGAVFDRKTIERLVVFGKTAQPGKQADVDGTHSLMARKESIIMELSL